MSQAEMREAVSGVTSMTPILVSSVQVVTADVHRFRAHGDRAGRLRASERSRRLHPCGVAQVTRESVSFRNTRREATSRCDRVARTDAPRSYANF